jgi:hypothetical protein
MAGHDVPRFLIDLRIPGTSSGAGRDLSPTWRNTRIPAVSQSQRP